MTDAIQTTLAELVDFLQREAVPFAVIGGLAVSVRGEPRFTADVDVVVGIDLDRAVTLLTAVKSTSFRPLFDRAEELIQTACLLPLRHSETRIKVDVAIGLTGFEQQLIERASQVQLAGRSLPVAAAEDLILTKLIANRPRDLDDVAGIITRQGETLDWNYLLAVGHDLQETLGQDIVPRLQTLQRDDEAKLG